MQFNILEQIHQSEKIANRNTTGPATSEIDLQSDPLIACIVFGYDHFGLFVLLEKQPGQPWFFPSEKMGFRETAEMTATRLISTRLLSAQICLEELGCFSLATALQQSNTLAITFTTLIDVAEYENQNSSLRWYSLRKLPRLPKGSVKIIENALRTLQKRISHHPISYRLFPREFTLPQLHSIFQVVFECRFDRRNFDKKIISLKMLRRLNEKTRTGSKRPAQLYCFSKRAARNGNVLRDGTIIFKSIEHRKFQKL
jgi:8-oxo-dGTP diphosphatase